MDDEGTYMLQRLVDSSGNETIWNKETIEKRLK